MAVFTDKFTGKTYLVTGTTVTQFDGKAYFAGPVLNLWGKAQSVVEFSSSDLDGWLKMMGFRG
ncbi:hypothetical protein H8I91_21410 [Serratia fonticola]|uniref:hypothetical protein n=1 Tax=Serratia fonticola TaxID=47917 RepID=UPI0016445DBB|nr:hypothetical protein [Serratia fonticola]MBC3252826.1 hypothetical protein [Serratia fonticola]